MNSRILAAGQSREMVDPYAKFATDNLSSAARRIESGSDVLPDGNVVKLVTFLSRQEKKKRL